MTVMGWISIPLHMSLLQVYHTVRAGTTHLHYLLPVGPHEKEALQWLRKPTCPKHVLMYQIHLLGHTPRTLSDPASRTLTAGPPRRSHTTSPSESLQRHTPEAS